MEMENLNNQNDASKIQYLKELLKGFIEKNSFYNNLFLLIKMKYLTCYDLKNIINNDDDYRDDNEIYIPQNLLTIFNNNNDLTFNHISGGYLRYNDNFNEYFLNLLVIPKNIIHNYFSYNETGCCAEKDYVKDKLDLYFSILTYIYFHTHFSSRDDDKIKRFLKNFIENEMNKNFIDSLYNSTVYNFEMIPDDIKNFIYEFSDVQVHSLRFYNHYNHTRDDDDNVSDFTNFIAHHIVTIFRFYKQYIISYFMTDLSDTYKIHPLEKCSLANNVIKK